MVAGVRKSADRIVVLGRIVALGRVAAPGRVALGSRLGASQIEGLCLPYFFKEIRVLLPARALPPLTVVPEVV